MFPSFLKIVTYSQLTQVLRFPMNIVKISHIADRLLIKRSFTDQQNGVTFNCLIQPKSQLQQTMQKSNKPLNNI